MFNNEVQKAMQNHSFSLEYVPEEKQGPSSFLSNETTMVL